MAVVACTQCGAQAPQSAVDSGDAAAPTRCRFCGHVFGAAPATKAPPAAPVVPIISSPPPRRTAPHAPVKTDRLSEPFDANELPAAPELRAPRWPKLLLLLVVVLAGAVVFRPVQMGLSPDWYRSLIGKHVSAQAQAEVAQGYVALDRGSSRSLLEAKQCFERACRVDSQYALAHAGLAEVQLAMAQSLGDAAQDMQHFSQGLTRKEMRRAQHDAENQNLEAKAWLAQAVREAQTAVQLAPNTAPANRAMAEVLRQQADLIGAQAWAQGGRASITEDAGMLVVQASLLGARDLAGACALLERALQKNPRNNRARYKLAQYALKRKDAARALEAINAILSSAPEHELAQQMLMRLQPAASQADKVQRPIVLAYAGAVPDAGTLKKLADAETPPQNSGAQPSPKSAAAPAGKGQDKRHALVGGAGDNADSGSDDESDDGEAQTRRGPPLTFVAQAKAWTRNVWERLGMLASGKGNTPIEPVAPSDLGAGMPLPSGPTLAPPAAPSAASPTPEPQPSGPAAPNVAPTAVDKAVLAAARAPVTGTITAARPTPAAADIQGAVPADIQRLSVAELLQRAQGLREAHNAKDAIVLYRLAARRAPNEGAPLLGVGFCALDLGAHKDAADAFSDALRLSSWQAQPHFGLAQALQAQGRRREAIGHYRRYLAIEPGGADAQTARQMLEKLSK